MEGRLFLSGLTRRASRADRLTKFLGKLIVASPAAICIAEGGEGERERAARFCALGGTFPQSGVRICASRWRQVLPSHIRHRTRSQCSRGSYEAVQSISSETKDRSNTELLASRHVERSRVWRVLSSLSRATNTRVLGFLLLLLFVVTSSPGWQHIRCTSARAFAFLSSLSGHPGNVSPANKDNDDDDDDDGDD